MELLQVEIDLNQEWNNLIVREREIAKGMLASQAVKQVPEKVNLDTSLVSENVVVQVHTLDFTAEIILNFAAECGNYDSETNCKSKGANQGKTDLF